MKMHMSFFQCSQLILGFALSVIIVTSVRGEETVTWSSDQQKLEFNLSRLSGVLDLSPSNPRYSTHHFSDVRHKPTGTLISPDKPHSLF